MGIYLELVNFDELIARSRHVPTIVNDIAETSVSEKERIHNKISTKYETDLLSNIPSCDCGHTTGEYNLGVQCPKCFCDVEHPRGDLEPMIWIRAPKGVRAIINPTIWSLLVKRFSKSGFSLMNWITEPSYRPDVNFPDYWPQIEQADLKRGYNYFVDNFDRLMELFFSLKGITRRGQVDPTYQVILENRQCIFSQYLPVVNRSLLVIEKNNSGTYVDTTMIGAIDAVTTMIGIDTETSVYSQKEKENRTVRMIDEMAEYYVNIYTKSFSPKEGIFRKQVFGTRTRFSFRCVVSSITEPHHYDEVHIPWGVAIGLYKIHLTNKLMRDGQSPNEAADFLNGHVDRYHPYLEKLFAELIDEANNAHCYPDDPDKHKGVMGTLLRNPSLGLGSVQAVRITKVKSNVTDKTMSISILIVSPFNADQCHCHIST